MGRPVVTITTKATDFMAVIPPWLNIDPIAPARIRLAANAQRDAAAAQSQELQFRREQLAAQQAQESEKTAAQERSALRRDQVLRQTHDQELAQAAEQMQLRRESQAQKSAQFQQQLRMKQQAAEVEAKNAAQQMQGMKALQEGLKKGRPMQELLAENAPNLFAGRADRAVGALQRGSHVAPVPDYVAHELKDEQGNPTGVKVRRGAGGSIVPLPRTEMSPEGRMRQDQLLANIYGNQLKDATGEEEVAIKKKLSALQQRIEKDIERRGTQQTPGPLPPRGTAFPVNPIGGPGGPPAPAAQSIPPSEGGASAAPDEGGASVESDEEGAANMVRVKSPDGKMGVIPKDQLDDALEAGYEEIESDNEGQA